MQRWWTELLVVLRQQHLFVLLFLVLPVFKVSANGRKTHRKKRNKQLDSSLLHLCVSSSCTRCVNTCRPEWWSWSHSCWTKALLKSYWSSTMTSTTPSFATRGLLLMSVFSEMESVCESVTVRSAVFRFERLNKAQVSHPQQVGHALFNPMTAVRRSSDRSLKSSSLNSVFSSTELHSHSLPQRPASWAHQPQSTCCHHNNQPTGSQQHLVRSRTGDQSEWVNSDSTLIGL